MTDIGANTGPYLPFARQAQREGATPNENTYKTLQDLWAKGKANPQFSEAQHGAYQRVLKSFADAMGDHPVGRVMNSVMGGHNFQHYLNSRPAGDPP